MFDMQNSQYFKSLSKFVQESVMQSGIIFDTENDLRGFVANLYSE